MTVGGERALLTRLLRESVLTLCREAMASHGPLSVDGIVCVSLGDADSGNDGTTIVVTIHEQLPKARGTTSPPLRCLPPAGGDGAESLAAAKETAAAAATTASAAAAEVRPSVPMDRKSQLLRRAFQFQPQSQPLPCRRPDVPLAPQASPCRPHSPARTLQRPRCVSEHLPAKLPRLDEEEKDEEEEEEGDGERKEWLDGHISDPTPEIRRTARHSASLSSSQSGEGRERAGSWRSSVSSPDSSDVSTSACEDVSSSARAGSASPQNSSRSSALPPQPCSAFQSAPPSPFPAGSGRGRGRLTCRRCGVQVPDVLTLERHNLQAHSCFTCHVCFSTFTARNNLKRHARLHSGIKPYKCGTCGAAFSRRDDLKTHRQRHAHRSNKVDPRRRHDYCCKLCDFVGTSVPELRKHQQTHAPRARVACSPCGLTFSHPAAYSSHVKSHSQDPQFRRYLCGFCPSVLPSYTLFVSHQQSHGLQHHHLNHSHSHQPPCDCTLCGKQFRSAAHLREHMATHGVQSADPSQPASAIIRKDARGCSSEQTPRKGQADRERERGEEEEEEEEGREDLEEAGSGPRQSWCTECQVGFPDEDTLIQHIAHTHEVVTDSRRPHAPDHEAETEGKNPRPDSMDTSENEHQNGDLAEGGPDRDGEDGTSETEKRMTEEDSNGRGVEAETAERGGEGVGGSGNEEMLKSLSTRSEALGREDASRCLQDASSTAARSLRHSAPSPRRASSPLRLVPLSLPRPGLTLEGSTPADSPPDASGQTSTGSLMTLVKPNDLVIDTVIHPPSSPPLAVTFREAAPAAHSRHFRYLDSLGRAGSKCNVPRHVENFLHVERTSPPSSSLLKCPLLNRCTAQPSAPGLRVKEEPLSDQEESGGSDTACHRDCPSAPRDYLRMSRDYMRMSRDCLGMSRDCLDMPAGCPEPPQLSPDLPTDLSMSRCSSTSPRSSAASDSGRSPGVEKVVTPEVLFRDRLPLHCPAKDCGQPFRRYADLEEHSARQHRRYLCQYCGTSFTAKPNRDRHVRYHTGEKPYKCRLCSQAFHRGDDLKYHLTTKHPRDSVF